MWSGSIASIPTGWVICNGSSGTPDLRSRFVVGAGGTFAVGDTGGNANAVVVAHTHTMNFNSSTASANHTHGPGSGSTFLNGDGVEQLKGGPDLAFSRTGTTAAAGADHVHAVNGTTDSSGGSATNANLPPYYALAYIMKS